MKQKADMGQIYRFLCTTMMFIVAVGFLYALCAWSFAHAEQVDFLSPEDREWLDSRDGIIRVAPDPHYPPMEYFDEQGIYRGIAADYLRLIEEKLQIRFEIVRLENFEEVLAAIRRREADISATVIKTPERSEYLLFTEPYISIPNVIVVRDDQAGLLTVDDLRLMENFVYQAGYAIGDVLVERDGITHGHPITDPAEALMDLSLGRIDAMVGNLAVISYYLRRQNITNLRVAGDCDFHDALSFASRSDWPILNRILDETLLRISFQERDRIVSEWIKLELPAFFHEMFQQHGSIMLLIDPQSGAIVDANSAAVAFYGYSRDQLQGMTIHDINTMTPDEVDQELRVAARQDRNYFIFSHRLASGEVRTVEAFPWPVTIHDRRLLFSIIQDVTPRIAAEEALRKQTVRFVTFLVLGMTLLAIIAGMLAMLVRTQRRTVVQREEALRALGDSERTLSTLLSNLPGMAYRCRFDRHWTMLFVSGGCRQLTGYSPDDIIHNARISYSDITHGDDREYVWNEIENAIAEKRNFTLEYRIITATGEEKWVWERGSAVAEDEEGVAILEGFITDISHRKKAEAEQERYRSFIENVEDGCFELDLAGNLVFHNEAFLRFSGFSYQEYVRRSYRDRHPTPEEAQRVFNIYNQVYQTGIPAMAVEYEFEKKNGDVGILEASISLTRDNAGNPTGFRGVGRDVTERKRLDAQREEALAEVRRLNAELEDRVRQRTAQLEASNRELEAFAYSVSHDLRAPLRAIDGFSRALEEDCGDLIDDTGKSHLERIRAGARRMSRLIDELLDLSRITRSEMRYVSVDMSAAAEDIHEELRQESPERKVDVKVEPGMTARGDRTLLRLMLHNLFENAWKFTNGTEGATIEFGSTIIDGRKVWYVRDNGVGFDMAYGDKIFGAFQRLHSSGEFPGTGIGLAIVQRIVHRHGGMVWAEGVPGEGAAFYFSL